MKNHKHIIVINGRDYNAKTGEALSPSVKSAAAVAATRHPEAVKPHAPASRKPARHVTPHAPKPTRTLMRQGVKKPSASLKRRVRVQGHLSSPPAQTHRQSASKPIPAPRHQAAKTRNGQLISHFSPDLFTNVTHITVKTSVAPVKRAEPQVAVRPSIAAQKPRTTAELLDYAIEHANVPEPLPLRKTHRKLFKRHAHAAAH